MTVDYLESIERISRLECGFSTVKVVKYHRLENRMEQFFLAETLKYLYLIFDEENFLHNDLSSDDYMMVNNGVGKYLFQITTGEHNNSLQIIFKKSLTRGLLKFCPMIKPY